jgi:ATP-dependent exoDNAse (exonuclease V) beta subunit
MTKLERKPSDAAIRLRAVDPRRSFLVQAPAGSGKTELLTDRILALLATVRRPEDIVAITFTRKAAAEMHDRVLKKLSAAMVLDSPPEAEHDRRSWLLAQAALKRDKEFGWNLLDYPARLAIRTIDSFCSGLVRSMPWLSSMGGVPSVAEDPEVHYQAAARATIAMAGQEQGVRRLLEHMDLDVQVTCDALAGMLAQRDQWLSLLQEGDDRLLLEENFEQTVTQQLERLLGAMPAGWSQELAPLARIAADNLMQETPDHPVCALLDWDGEPLEAIAIELSRWRGLAALLLTAGKKTVRAQINVKIGFPAGPAFAPAKQAFAQWLERFRGEPAPEWVERLAEISDTPYPEFSEDQWEILQAQLQCLRLAAGQLTLQFMSAGEVDFTEIARRADLALGRVDQPSELLLRLDANIQHLLIDEFQDTSQSQIQLIEKITAGWQSDDGRTVFFVGDPMQSIYRFRKANVSLFLQVRDHGLRAFRDDSLQPEYLQLSDNFRSQAGIVDWVNQTFKPMFPETDDAEVGAISYASSEPFKAIAEGDAVQFHHAWVGASRSTEHIVVDLVRQALAEFSNAAHPVAVLVRARSHLKDVTRLLAQAGIACRAVDLVPLNKRPYVIDLVQIVRAVTHPGDRAAWVSILRSAYCGLSLNSLHALFGQYAKLSIPQVLHRVLRVPDDGSPCQAEQSLAPSEFERLRSVAPMLLEALEEDDVLPFATRMQRLWRDLGGPALAQSAADLLDAESLFALIERLAPYGGLDIGALEKQIKKLFASPGTDTQAVEVMTMHKCKGLQFESVILYGLHHGSTSDRVPLVYFEQVGSKLMLGPIKPRAREGHDPISRYLGLREKRRGDFEVDRLLYVAATRAKERLHLVADVGIKDGAPAKPPAGSLLSRLWLSWPSLEVPSDLLQGDAAAESMPAHRGSELFRQSLSALRARSEKTTQQANQATASGAGYSQAFAWAASKSHDRVLGTLIHSWLDHLGRQSAQGWTVEKMLAQRARIELQCRQLGLPAEEIVGLAHEVLETLLAMLTSKRGQDLLACLEARREWALLDATGKVSILDLAISDSDGWLVVDYKTGRPAAEESTEAFGARMLSRYAPQLARYCEQVSALDGRRARAALYFPRDDLWIDFDPRARS